MIPLHNNATSFLQLAEDLPDQVAPLFLRPLLVVVALLVMALLLVAAAVLWFVMLSRTGIPAAALVPVRLRRQGWRRANATASKVDVDATSVFLGREVKAHLTAHLLHTRLDLLHAARRVVALADDDVQVRLPARSGIADARLENVLGLLDKLPVQVDGVVGHPPGRVILAEYELGRLPVVGLLLLLVPLALVRERLGLGAVAALIGFVSLMAGEGRTNTMVRRTIL